MNLPTEFQLKQRVTFVVNPQLKGIVTGILFYADGGIEYKVSYYDDGVKETYFFPCELLNDDE